MAPRFAFAFAFQKLVVAQGCINPGGTSWIDCITQAGNYILPEGTYILDRHWQMPDGVSLFGAGPGKTIIEADHAVENGCGTNTDHPGDPSTRIGFVLGNNCSIGKFTFLGKDDHRWQDYYGAALCGGAVFETPGCSDAYCESENIGEGHGDGGVTSVRIEDVVISGATPDTAPQLAVFITQTKDLSKPTDGVHIKGVHMDHSWCDGINLHGATRNAVVEDCMLSFQGDDNLAVWSAGDRADNITFRNNVVSQARTENHPSPRWGNCVALYGGSRINVVNTTCYHSSNSGVKISQEFQGSWGPQSNINVEGTVIDEDWIPACSEVGSGGVFHHGGAIFQCEEKSQAVPLPGWTRHESANCHQGAGGIPVPPDSYAPDEGITPVACMAACAGSVDACAAVVTSADGGCWLRKEVDLGSCEQQSESWPAPGYYDTWVAGESPPPALVMI